MHTRGGERARGVCVRGRAACKGRGREQGGCMQEEGLHARGGGGTSEQVSRGGGMHPFHTPCAQ